MLAGSLVSGSQTALVVGINKGTFTDLNIGSKALLQPKLNRGTAGILLADHGVDADPAFGMQAGVEIKDHLTLMWVIERVSSASAIARSIVR